MRNRQLFRQLQQIEWLISQTNLASNNQLELQAHWGRYLCVLVAGFMENAYTEVYSEFVRNAASESVANFAISGLLRVRNPKSQRFIDTAGAFKSEWAGELERFLAENGRKDALDSVMANRHIIAHGRNVGITVSRVKGYLDRCIELIEFIENQCGR